VVSVLESGFWVLLQDVLDLAGPVQESLLEVLSFVLA
jgi:hypothetical protein